MATEVTVDNDLVVGGTLLVDAIDASFASELSIKDNVFVGLTTAIKDFTVYGNLSISGSLSGNSPFWVVGRTPLFLRARRTGAGVGEAVVECPHTFFVLK